MQEITSRRNIACRLSMKINAVEGKNDWKEDESHDYYCLSA